MLSSVIIRERNKNMERKQTKRDEKRECDSHRDGNESRADKRRDRDRKRETENPKDQKSQ